MPPNAGLDLDSHRIIDSSRLRIPKFLENLRNNRLIRIEKTKETIKNRI